MDKRYSVKYELDAHPSEVIVEVVCKSEEEMKQVYEERKNACSCKRVTQNISE